MGVSIDDKLKMFHNLLMEEINAENEKMVAKLSLEYDTELASSKNKIQMQADKILEEAKITSKYEVNNQLQKNASEHNKQLLFTMKQYTEELLRMLREKVQKMPEAVMRTYMENSLLSASRMFEGDTELILKVERPQRALLEEIIQSLRTDGRLCGSFRIVEADIGGLGGLVAENEEGTLRADFSISYYLEENKELVGRTIQAKLEEVMRIDAE